MAARLVKSEKLGIPRFKWRPRKKAAVFDLSSHERAREALQFGLSVNTAGFNIFVLGPDAAGRMTETMAFIEGTMTDRPPASDWVYLNNFRRPHRPKPFRLTTGTGRRLRDEMQHFATQMRSALKQAFESEAYQQRVKAAQQRLAEEAEQAMALVRDQATSAGLTIFQGEQGAFIAPTDEKGQPLPLESVPEAERESVTHKARALAEQLSEANTGIAKGRAELAETITKITRDFARDTCSLLLKPLIKTFAGHGLNRWFVELEQDILENLAAFGPAVDPQGRPNVAEPPERRYAVNLLVDNGDDTSSPIVLESAPTFENLFGRIECRPGQNHFETDFTLIRAGALHRANGGVLVLRAEALALESGSWPALVATLRDGRVRIEERHRQNSLPIVGAPSPKAVELDLKVVIVGSPVLYYAGYSKSPDFQGLFKVKADIAQDMPANAANLSIYGSIVRDRALKRTDRRVTLGGVGLLLGLAARWSGDRTRLSARLELLDDVVEEAAATEPRQEAVGRKGAGRRGG